MESIPEQIPDELLADIEHVVVSAPFTVGSIEVQYVTAGTYNVTVSEHGEIPFESAQISA